MSPKQFYAYWLSEDDLKKEYDKAFVDGIVSCLQFLEAANGGIAVRLIRDSGIKKSEFVESQKRSGYKTAEVMNLINVAFKK